MRLFAAVALLVVTSGLSKYQPTWDSLDQRPLPSWYDEAKVGIFVHWGPYSVPGVVSEWFWFYYVRNDRTKLTDVEVNKFMKENYPPGFRYQEFGKQFRAEFFNATEWVDIIENSGAKYFVITTKHHDGFAMWPSRRNFGWNSMDVGPNRDIIGELKTAFDKNEKVKFGIYYSLFEWFNRLYIEDQATNCTSRTFVTEKVWPELKELIDLYKPNVLWSDGEAGATVEYWRAKEFLTWLYNESPVKDRVVTNDRWGIGTQCKHGGFYTCADRYNPGKLQNHKWENAMTLDRMSWGNRRNMALADVLTIEELLRTLAETISCGGNILINIGPTKDGTIPVIFQERLQQLGQWLTINGQAVYGSVPWEHQNDSQVKDIWYTADKSRKIVYAFLPKWPTSNKVMLRDIATYLTSKSVVTVLGCNRCQTDFKISDKIVTIHLPDKALMETDWVYVLAFQL